MYVQLQYIQCLLETFQASLFVPGPNQGQVTGSKCRICFWTTPEELIPHVFAVSTFCTLDLEILDKIAKCENILILLTNNLKVFFAKIELAYNDPRILNFQLLRPVSLSL